jgi:Kef-type K+ transport system membrane component KefB
VVADIQPFRGILLGLFFMTVGMSIERQAVLEHGLMLLAIALALMAVKTLVTFGVMRTFRIPAGEALHGALLLSQTGEFALILFALAAGENLISAAERQMLYQVVVFSMLLTAGPARATPRGSNAAPGRSQPRPAPPSTMPRTAR